MIRLEKISKKYYFRKNIIYAISEISMQINHNEFVSIMGKSGSGKSTLLNIIGGILKPDSGNYYFDDKLMNENESYMAKFRSEHIGFILQHNALISSRNVYYNISLPLRYQKMDKKDIQKNVEDIAESLGISGKLKMFPHMLSGGECQRVAIARALISHPSVILADEPTSSLDEENKYEVIEILKRLSQNGKTIVLATHDKSIAAKSDRLINIHDGEILNK